jgi:hypothetical protein
MYKQIRHILNLAAWNRVSAVELLEIESCLREVYWKFKVARISGSMFLGAVTIGRKILLINLPHRIIINYSGLISVAHCSL